MENLGGWDHSEDHPDFDPNLLNVESWNVDHSTDDVNVSVGNVTDPQEPSHTGSNTRLHFTKKNNNTGASGWDDGRQVDQWPTLGVTEFDHAPDTTVSERKEDGGLGNTNGNNITFPQPPTVAGIPNETVEAAVEAAVAAISETSDSVNSGDRSGGSSENNTATYNNLSQHLHPMGIQFSASCPTPAHTNGTAFQQQQQQQRQVPPQPQPQHPQQQQQQQPQQPHTIPGVCGVNIRQSVTSNGSKALQPTTVAPAIPNVGATSQHLSSLTANFMLAQAANSATAAAAAMAAAAAANGSLPVTTAGGLPQGHPSQQHAASVISQPSTNPSLGIPNSKATSSSRQRSGGTRKSKSTSKSKKKKTSTNEVSDASTAASSAAASSSGLPPFYLFDAPIELRANFMQNQRRLGLPIQHDPNSYHYGETVNGFHPHQYQVPISASGAAAGVPGANAPPVRPPNAPPPQLIDARHGNHRKNKGGQVKNEREQKRAQKITELIEQLRLQMEKGGWQVEARSKYHTLSNCAQYIKNMIKLTSDKENENQKLNAKLDEKRRKFERENEEKAMQEGRSDPESVTSSLTSDTTMSTARHKQEEETSSEDAKKRKLFNNSNRERGSSGDDSNNNNDASNGKNKKRRIASGEATTEDSSGDDNRGGSGTGSGSGNSGTGSGSGGSGSGSGGPSAQGCSITKTVSSVSELTDSNRGSSSNNSGSGAGSSDDNPTEQDSRESTSGKREDGVDQPSTSSISSDAAVASEKTSRDRNTGHKDVVFNNDKRMSRKRPPEEVTSLERTFELNYEEVFHKSNIPQLIASTSGKIVTWNECFCKATGYRKSEIERMTIFSLVKPENLANFFEIVAAALRPDDEEIAKERKNNSEIGNKNGEEKVTEANGAKQNTISDTSSPQDSLSSSDTVICSNNEKIGGDQGDNKNTELERTEDTNDSSVKVEKVNTAENIVYGSSGNEKSSSNSTEEEGATRVDKSNTSEIPANQESNSNLMDEDKITQQPTNEESSPNLSNATKNGNSTSEENGTNSTVEDGASKNKFLTSNQEADDTGKGDGNKINTVSKENENDTANEKDNENEEIDSKDVNLVKDGRDEIMSKRLLNYTAMTLPCIDFPAMKKRNHAAVESNTPIIPPLHVTVTLMSDKDPRRRCFHCVFTNSKGTNGALGIITPELLASLFAKPLRNSRRKKNHYSSHGGGTHQRKRAREGTTRVGQSVSTSTSKNDELHEKSPSPLLMPPPGPLMEDNSKQEENEPKKVKTEMADLDLDLVD